MKVVERDETMADWMVVQMEDRMVVLMVETSVVQKVGEKADWMVGLMVA